jgi:hypothetical protein
MDDDTPAMAREIKRHCLADPPGGTGDQGILGLLFRHSRSMKDWPAGIKAHP